jgi:hypothetical protein
MKTFIFGFALFLAMVLVAGTSSADNKYVGAKKCGMCHKSATLGAAYTIWEKSPHAHAFEILKGKDAEAVAKKAGVKDPSSDLKCLKCHVTGGGSAAGIDKSEGVGCEECHGAASGFLMIHNKKDEASKAKAKEAGLILSADNGKLCERCHNAQSPNFKGFKFKEMWAKIEHKLPKQ